MSAGHAQLLTAAPTLALSWNAADPEAAASLLPADLEPADGVPVFLNQYTVPRGATSLAPGPQGSEPFSVTHMGIALAEGADELPARWWVAYLVDSDAVADLAARDGAPVEPGETSVEADGTEVRAMTVAEGGPLVRAVASFDRERTEVLAGHAHYVSGEWDGRRRPVYPFAAGAHPVRSAAVEFLDPDHPSWALRPPDPLRLGFAYFAPAMAFAFPPAA